jgi:site-specific recombinase XerD
MIGEFDLSEKTMGMFIEDARSCRRMLDPDYRQCFVRCFRILQSIEKGEDLKSHYRKKLLVLPDRFLHVSTGYSRWLSRNGQCQNTIETKVSRLLCFLLYLSTIGISENEIQFETILNFKDCIQSRGYSEAYKANILFSLKDFIEFLVETGILETPANEYVGTVCSHKDSRLCSYYSSEEIGRVLLGMDRSTVLGKRDYAIMVLLAELGLRESDMLRLRMDEFDWTKKELSLRTGKTKHPLTLPLTDTLLLALADYIKNARPDSDPLLLFPRTSPSLEGTYSRGMIYYVADRHFKRAGIATANKHHGPHALRHSLTSSLYRQDVAPSTISTVLGHSSTNVTKAYLWMAVEQLRKLALEVPYGK